MANRSRLEAKLLAAKARCSGERVRDWVLGVAVVIEAEERRHLGFGDGEMAR